MHVVCFTHAKKEGFPYNAAGDMRFPAASVEAYFSGLAKATGVAPATASAPVR